MAPPEVRRSHHLPFGAQILAGGVRFRLWAPSAKAVTLLLRSSSGFQALQMQAQPRGWFELITANAHAGTRYKYLIHEGLIHEGRIHGGTEGDVEVPDPAARANDDLDGCSIVVDPLSYVWKDESWHGRPWHEAVIYELHVGTFTPEGTYAAIQARLDHLVQLGVTVIELMPLNEFPGQRGWGYDGVLPFAPDAAYGKPEELKALIDAAHQRGLAVMLDVVYNHFGPEGNWLHRYAKGFFTERHHTPWGAAINFDGTESPMVRNFFIQNALYWLEEYRFDGLRLDAVHAMRDDSELHFIRELVQAVRNGPGTHRDVYLVLENGDNTASLLGAPGDLNHADAQWNDDVHHCLHVILTGETDGYYEDYAERPHALLCRSLAEGFAYQGEASEHRGATPHGEPSAHLPPTAFVNFLQNHDQIGNRAFGERLSQMVQNEAALIAATSILLLAPSPPMLFMGEEWAAPEPFVYFCDFGPQLAEAVRTGRKREFAKFKHFEGAQPPDPTAPETFAMARLDWRKLSQPAHAKWLELYRRLLAIRQRDIVPLIPSIRNGHCTKLEDTGAFAVDWPLHDGSVLHLLTNLTGQQVPVVGRAAGRLIYATHPSIRAAIQHNTLEPWSVTWLLERARDDG